jgi:zinc protease
MIALLMSLAWGIDRPAPLPDALPTEAWHVTPTATTTLDNGLDVYTLTLPEVPLFEVRLVLPFGEDADPKGKEGLTALAVDLLDEGTARHTAAELSREASRLGCALSVSTRADYTTLKIEGLARNLDPALDLLADVLFRPSKPADRFGRLRDQHVADANLAREDPSTVGRNVMHKLFYGASYTGRHATAETLEGLTLKDASAHLESFLAPQGAAVLAGGDLPADITKRIADRFGGWKKPAPPTLSPPAPLATKPTLYFVDKPGAAQSVVAGGQFIGTRKDADYQQMKVGFNAYGASFTSRVNLNLREDKGYTYGARCSGRYLAGPGRMECMTSVRADATAASLTEMRKELDELLGDRPLTEEEVATARSALTQRLPSDLETPAAILGWVEQIWRRDLPADYIETTLPGIRAVDRDGANKALRGRLSVDSTFWLVVGDKSAVWESLQGAGLPIVELDRDGDVLPSQ